MNLPFLPRSAFVLVLALIVLTAGSASASLLFYDDFDGASLDPRWTVDTPAANTSITFNGAQSTEQGGFYGRYPNEYVERSQRRAYPLDFDT